METLLEKFRFINKLLQKTDNLVDFDQMANVLGTALQANCYIVGKKGKIHGYFFVDDFHCGNAAALVDKQARFPEAFNNFLMSMTKTQANMEINNQSCMVNGDVTCKYGEINLTLTPILCGGERLGTLFVSKRQGGTFTEEDLILVEYGATVVGMEIYHSRIEKMEEESRAKAAAHIAFKTLSYSEAEAVEHIFAEIENGQGMVVASKIADKAGITRSVIVNALRKFESAGVIESRSLGMKGTFIRIINKYLMDELSKIS